MHIERRRLLVCFLRGSALILLGALLASFFPHAWMQTIHQLMGLGDLPDTPMVQYLARSVAALYAQLGLFYWFVSYDVPRYARLLRFSAWVKFAFGMLVLGVDVFVGMPGFWIAIEGPFILTWSLTLRLLLGHDGDLRQ